MEIKGHEDPVHDRQLLQLCINQLFEVHLALVEREVVGIPVLVQVDVELLLLADLNGKWKVYGIQGNGPSY